MRRKNLNMTRIAKEIECNGEYCGDCDRCFGGISFRKCTEFDRELKKADGKKKAERCSDCHLAERLANGEEMR